MRFVLEDRQQQFRGAARAFFQGEWSEGGSVARAERRRDCDSWVSAVDALGVNSLMVPVEFGGLGATFLDLAMVIEEGGRALVDLPVATSVATATPLLVELVRRAPEGPAGALLGRLAETPDTAVVLGTETQSAEFRQAGARDLSLTAHFGPVLDLSAARFAMVFGRCADRPCVGLVEFEEAETETIRLRSLDITRTFGAVRLRDAHATYLADDPDGALCALALATGRSALALDAAGGARRCVELAVAYAKQREQFGRPIGSFQAIKHKCADMLLKVETATSAAEAAAWMLSQPDHDLNTVLATATLAKAYACDAYCWVSGELIQVLGGIGFTWEHPAHLFFKRAKASAMLLGTPEQLRHEEARRLLSTH